MNDTSGFQDVRASIFRSPSSRFLHEQRGQCRTGFRVLLHTHDISLGISTKQGTVLHTVSVSHKSEYWDRYDSRWGALHTLTFGGLIL